MAQGTNDPSRPTLGEIEQAVAAAAAGEATLTTDVPGVDRSANIRIDRQGRWHHEGRPIRRERLVRLFASVLEVDEDDQGWLVTPHERLSVEIEDAPFVAIDVRRVESADGPALVFTTNVGDEVVVDADHPVDVTSRSGDPDDYRPYVLVRDRLRALILRSTYHQLAAYVDERDGVLGIESRGLFMPLEQPPVS